MTRISKQKEKSTYMKVLVIGIGNMGGPYAQAMSNSELLKENQLWIYDRNEHKLIDLEKAGNLKAHLTLETCLPHSDIVFIAVKPHQTKGLFEEIKDFIQPHQIFVSIMAGVQLDTLSKGLGVPKIVRVMPNLPAKIGKGMTTFTATEAVSPSELKIIEDLIDMTGRSIPVEKEELIDASTAISGSGPAYVFYFMQAMIEAGMEMGFTDKESLLLVEQTFEGSVQLFRNAADSTATWINRVSSKGGTTEAAINKMKENKVKNQIKEAVFAAFKRAEELGKGS